MCDHGKDKGCGLAARYSYVKVTRGQLYWLLLCQHKLESSERRELQLRKGLQQARQWWYTPLISALERQKQDRICEFEASMGYGVSSMSARATQRNFVLKNKTKHLLSAHFLLSVTLQTAPDHDCPQYQSCLTLGTLLSTCHRQTQQSSR